MADTRNTTAHTSIAPKPPTRDALRVGVRISSGGCCAQASGGSTVAVLTVCAMLTVVRKSAGAPRNHLKVQKIRLLLRS